MNIGRLNECITLTPVTYVDDGIGGKIETEGTPFEVWASIDNMSQKEVLEHGLIKGSKAYKVTIRYDLDVTIDRYYKFEIYGEDMYVLPLANRKLDNNELKFIAYVS